MQPLELERSAGTGMSWRLRHLRLETTHVAVLYLVAIGLAEFVTAVIDPTLGVICHIFILLNLLIQASLTRPWWERGFFLSLAIAPVIRIVSLGMPLGSFPQEWWYLLSAIPLYATCWAVIRTVPLTRREIGLQLPEHRHWLLTALVGLSGIPLGLTEYLILRPDPIVSTFALGGVALAAMILLVGTGVIEELIFRGILQATTSEIFGPWWAILYVSVLFGELHTGHMSVLDVFFVIGVAIYFAVIVRKTRSLIGVSVSHGLTNIFLFIVFPLVHFL